jgi:hypothetical protein
MATAMSRRVTNSATAATAQRRTLADAINGGRQLPSRIVLHGQGGIGKTSFAAFAPRPFFLLSPGETGLHTLADAGLVAGIPNIEVNDWSELLDLINQLIESDHDYKTVVLDTIDGFEKLANQYVCNADFNGDWGEKGFMGYQRGYKVVASGQWRMLLAALDKLRTVRGVRPICLAHTGVGNIKNPEGPDYDRWLPDMYKDAWQLTSAWADIVLFAQPVVEVVKEKGSRNNKGRSSGHRVLVTEWQASADAKNRHNLSPEIDMGQTGAEAWANFVEDVKNSRNNAAEGNGSNGK